MTLKIVRKPIYKDNQLIAHRYSDERLPKLQGTPRQVKWARDIRYRMVNLFEEGAIMQHMLSQTEAVWFIDRREGLVDVFYEIDAQLKARS